MDAETLKRAIFHTHTRRLGHVAEEMIRRLHPHFQKPLNKYHDLYDPGLKMRVEVKFSTVRRKSPPLNGDGGVLASLLKEMDADRAVRFEEWKNVPFTCNIQQVKKAEFDVLYYGLFFDDVVKVFKALPGRLDGVVDYCEKQHKGNHGEGQFHITDKNLQVHLDSFLENTLSYQDVLGLLATEDREPDANPPPKRCRVQGRA